MIQSVFSGKTSRKERLKREQRGGKLRSKIELTLEEQRPSEISGTEMWKVRSTEHMHAETEIRRAQNNNSDTVAFTPATASGNPFLNLVNQTLPLSADVRYTCPYKTKVQNRSTYP